MGIVQRPKALIARPTKHSKKTSALSRIDRVYKLQSLTNVNKIYIVYISIEIVKLVMSGRMGLAIEHTQRTYPGVLESNLNLLFMLKCRQFVEMVNGSDFEVSVSVSIVSSRVILTNCTTIFH